MLPVHASISVFIKRHFQECVWGLMSRCGSSEGGGVGKRLGLRTERSAPAHAASSVPLPSTRGDVGREISLANSGPDYRLDLAANIVQYTTPSYSTRKDSTCNSSWFDATAFFFSGENPFTLRWSRTNSCTHHSPAQAHGPACTHTAALISFWSSCCWSWHMDWRSRSCTAIKTASMSSSIPS